MPPKHNAITIIGAREHNLKNISLNIPRDSLTVITGLSGSGKSSLAFDTIYAEGQRRYVESLSAYARQFLESSHKPDIDRIDGLSPAISIEQKTASRNPRSTVGTVTEIYDYMRILFARAGIAYSPATGKPIESQTISEMVDKTMTRPNDNRFYLLAPIVRGRKGEYKKEFADLLKQGFQRIKADGTFYELENPPKLNKKIKHDIDVVIDRLIMRDDLAERLAESFETALRLSDGLAVIEDAENPNARQIFSERFACPVSGFTIEEIEPRLFSFNSPRGACPACDGLGVKPFADPDLVIPNPNLSIREGAIAAWATAGQIAPYYTQLLESLARHYGFSTTTPWKNLAEEAQNAVLYGSDGERVQVVYQMRTRRYEASRPFEGVLPNLERRFRESGDKKLTHHNLSQYHSSAPCEACEGYRLRPEALCVQLGGRHIAEVSALSVKDLLDWFAALDAKLTKRQKTIAERVLREIRARLQFLSDVGLDYLTLSRNSATLSGGESQRIRLASQVGSGLTGVVYVLDEPSIGLHARDNARLLASLRRLKDLGNTVILVEHDEEAIRSADHVVDMGPGAGIHGGEVVAQGTPKKIEASQKSLTGRYLSGKEEIATPKTRRKKRDSHCLSLKGASGHNLRGVDAEFPLGLFLCMTGVSGSGKSTLLLETLNRALTRRLSAARVETPQPFASLDGAHLLDKVIEIDQSPIGRTPRSNPATYTGVFTPIREWFAGLPESRTRGYGPGRFSFNVKGGRCEACQGDGVLKIEMHFLPDVYVECDSCHGRRYNRETLEVLFREKSIADVLDMTVEEARRFFRAVPAIRDRLETLYRVGLDYIRIGQAATTLSGGEAQRIKLAKELSKRATGRTFYILDEPTTGLHFHDIGKLLDVLHALVKSGNTVAVIEHNLDVIKTADWVIDLGPEGGEAGGRIVGVGTPEEIARLPRSHTGKFLRALFDARSKRRKRGGLKLKAAAQ